MAMVSDQQSLPYLMSGMPTFAFYYGDDCAQSSSGMQVIVALSNDFGISWNVIRTLGKNA